MTSSRASCCGLIALAVLISFGALVFKTGFYCDDWHILRPLVFSKDASLVGLIHAFYAAVPWVRRPVVLVYHPLLFWLFGSSPAGYQAVYLGLDIISPILVFLALDRTSGSRKLSFLTALFFAVYPNHSGTHHYFGAHATPALPLLALSLERYSRYLETESKTALLASCLSFAAACLTYEAVLPLATMHLFLSWIKGRPRRCWPIFAVAALVLPYQALAGRLFSRVSASRPLALDPGFALRALGDGIECASTRILHLAWVYFPKAAAELPFEFWIVGGSLLIGLIAACLKASPRENPSARLLRFWAAGGILATLACYAIFSFAAQRQTPQIFSHYNRFNAAASLGSAMILAALLSALPRKIFSAALPALLILATVINWGTGWDWKLSWQAQQNFFRDLSPKLAGLPGPAHIVLHNVPNNIGGAPLFDGWPVEDAVQCVTGRADLHAHMEEGEAAEDHKNEPPTFNYNAKNGAFR
jgi:hypothetical protein